MGAERLHRIGAASSDAADHVVRVAVQGAAHRLRGIGQTCGDEVAVGIDLVRGFSQSARERVPMGAERLNCIGAAGGDVADDILRVGASSAAGLDGRSSQTHGYRIAL